MLHLDGLHVDFSHVLVPGKVLVQRVGRMYGIIGLSCVLASELHDDLGAARMFDFEFGDIVGSAVDDDPAVAIRGVLPDFFTRPLLGLGEFVGGVVVHLDRTCM